MCLNLTSSPSQLVAWKLQRWCLRVRTVAMNSLDAVAPKGIDKDTMDIISVPERLWNNSKKKVSVFTTGSKEKKTNNKKTLNISMKVKANYMSYYFQLLSASSFQ